MFFVNGLVIFADIQRRLVDKTNLQNNKMFSFIIFLTPTTLSQLRFA